MTRWSGGAARRAYSALLVLLMPAYVLRLWWRGRKEPLYRHAIGERLGRYPADSALPSRGRLWLHAVSLGETRAAAALVDALRARRPDVRLLLTHGTATGMEAGRELMRDGDLQSWLPYDTPGGVRRFLAQFQPAVGVLMETEVWPNLLYAAQQASVPMVLANARLSEKSLKKGERLDALIRPAVQSLQLVLAQTERDAQRLRAAGADPVVVSGNLKFDVRPDAAQLQQGRAWRAALQRPVVLAAATREGEEAMLLAAWAARHAGADRAAVPEPSPLLLIVPRHPQRFDEVAALVGEAGLHLARRSAWADAPPPDALTAQVWLGDSMREMALYYGCADVALLGGSFAPLGGQNLIEAAACGCPMVLGPHTFNFAEAAELSIAAGAAVRTADMPQAVARALSMLKPDVRERASADALAFAAAHGGAADRMADAVIGQLPR
ncbi:MAG: 3-deoxy-D-manno-octulosonic acid transferase [Methylibium sp. NZG]|nr:MAG: 3-deoxy-D-manno-octulosonic acid transferase [Methylibium sp. NZG]